MKRTSATDAPAPPSSRATPNDWQPPTTTVGVARPGQAASSRGLEHLFTLRRADQVANKPVTWPVEGYLARNSLAGIVVRPSGSGKSFIAVVFACCTAIAHLMCTKIREATPREGGGNGI